MLAAEHYMHLYQCLISSRNKYRQAHVWTASHVGDYWDVGKLGHTREIALGIKESTEKVTDLI